MNFANTTLGEMLSHKNEVIKRNGLSVLKMLQRERDAQIDHVLCGDCTHELVKPVTIDGIVMKDTPVYCDDCLDARRDWKDEDEGDEQ
jgi:hypothetical protein